MELDALSSPMLNSCLEREIPPLQINAMNAVLGMGVTPSYVREKEPMSLRQPTQLYVLPVTVLQQPLLPVSVLPVLRQHVLQHKLARRWDTENLHLKMATGISQWDESDSTDHKPLTYLLSLKEPRGKLVVLHFMCRTMTVVIFLLHGVLTGISLGHIVSRMARILCPSQEFLVQQLNNSGMLPASLIWIDGLYSQVLHEWEWVDRSPLTYTNWLPGEPGPLSSNQDYRIFIALPNDDRYRTYKEGPWRHGSSSIGNPSSPGPFICEKQKT